MPTSGSVRHDLTGLAIPEGMVRIMRDGSHRFIWPVHLGGWLALGWQLQPASEQQPAEPRLPLVVMAPEPVPELEPEPDPAPAAGATDFQAMTKAQIVEHCSTTYGADLDGSQTKAELIEQAIALESQNDPAAAGSGPEPLLQPESTEPLLDELLDDPLI